MSVEQGNAAVADAPGGDVGQYGQTESTSAATSGSHSSGQTSSQGTSATPPAVSPGGHSPSGNEYGDAHLDNDVPPPRARDEHGRFVRPDPAASQTQTTTATVPAGQAAPVAPAAQDWLDQGLLADASFYGFTEEDARAFESPERLTAAMAALDRRMLRDYGQPQQTPQGQVPPQAAGFSPAQQQPVAPVTGQPPAQAQSGFDLSKYKDLFDEDTHKVLSELQGHTQSELNRLQSLAESKIAEQQAAYERLEQTVRFMEQQAVLAQGQRFEAEMDDQFETIAKDYGDIFGKGPIRELPPEVKGKRQELAAYMTQLEQIDLQVGRPPVPMKQNFQRALRVLYGDRQAKAIRNQVAREVETRRSQQISRPTARTSAPINPLDAAARRADEIYKAKGFDVPTGDDFSDGI